MSFRNLGLATLWLVSLPFSPPTTAADRAADAATPLKPAVSDKDRLRDKTWGALQYRLIGPAVGGRVDRVYGVPGDRLTYYLAAAQGGIWKSRNGGLNWQPVFDEQPTQSIGSIAVSPSDPNVVYVGSGEANIRGNVGIGLGIFKSTDAGAHWTQVWKTRGQIGTMVVHPQNPDIAYAAVLGSPFGPNNDRGVYGTRNGGATWQRLLYRDADTGASDIAMDPGNPRRLIAGLWQARRTPWNMQSGGANGGLFLSEDGGDSWTPVVGDALPSGLTGKIGVAFAPSLPQRVYALIEAEKGGLFRSDDGGKSWRAMTDDHTLRQRAWYYSTLTVDPKDADTVWFPQVNLVRSIDGGKSVQSAQKGLHHGDCHDVWIDPTDTHRMIVANDGGVDISQDGGVSWFSPPLPLAQFYNIDVDDRVPYHVGGTMQDWGTATGPSRALNGSGNIPGLWVAAGGGEAGDFMYDRSEPGVVFAGEYGGYLSRYTEADGQVRNISVYPYDPSGHGAVDLQYRFQWTAPLAGSPHDPKVIYHGGNVLFRSRDRGVTWEAVSPDLTRNDTSKQQWSGGPITGDNTGVEIYDTIFSIAVAPTAGAEIWTGSDDGLVYVSRDDAKTWQAVTPPGLPAWAKVESIAPSPRRAGTVFVAADAHWRDDFHPYLFRTRDFGRSWQQVGAGIPEDVPVLAVREDPDEANMVYAGTERGVYVSRDGGTKFAPLKLNLPAVSVTDIEISHGDLVLGTRGRGIWVLPNIATVREANADARARALQLFTSPAAFRFRNENRWSGEGDIADPPVGALISYWLDKEIKGDDGELRMEIRDAAGTLVRTLSSTPKPAAHASDDPDEPTKPPEPELTRDALVNRVVWDLRHEGAKRLTAAKLDSGTPEVGPMVAPGRYALTLIRKVKGQPDQSSPGMVEVRGDPRAGVTDADITASVAFTLEIRDAMDRLRAGIEHVRAIREQAKSLGVRLLALSNQAGLAKQAQTLEQHAAELEGRMHNPDAQVVYDILAQKGGAQLYSQLSFLYSASGADTADAPPPQGARERLAKLQQEVVQRLGDVDQLQQGEVGRFEAALSAAGLPRILWVN